MNDKIMHIFKRILFILFFLPLYGFADDNVVCHEEHVAIRDCRSIGGGRTIEGDPHYYEEKMEICRSTPNCFLEPKPDYWWECAGEINCQNNDIKHNSYFCEKKDVCVCAPGYKSHSGYPDYIARCKKIICRYKSKDYVLHEATSENIYSNHGPNRFVIGNRLAQCREDGNMRFHVKCNDGWFRDGNTCVDDAPF